MTRKQFLLASAAAVASPAWAALRTQMGIATTCYLTAWRPKDTYEFLEHCHALGAVRASSWACSCHGIPVETKMVLA